MGDSLPVIHLSEDDSLGAEPPLLVRVGERVLFHIVNASATEPLALHLPGHLFQVYALDGCRVPVAASVETLSLGAGERASAIVQMNRHGSWILGSVTDQARVLGMGIVIAYGGHHREPVWSAPERYAGVLDYTQFCLACTDDRQPDAKIRLERRPKDRHGFEQWAMTAIKESAL
jgi:FtsP/CotA-like multicopper oxidase with cupredoxin domain